MKTVYKLSDEAGHLGHNYYSSVPKLLAAVEDLADAEEWDVSHYCLKQYGNEVRTTGDCHFRCGSLGVWLERIDVE